MIKLFPWTVASWQLQEDAIVAAAKDMFHEYKHAMQQERLAELSKQKNGNDTK